MIVKLRQGPGFGPMYDMMSGPWGPVMMILVVLFWLLVIAGVVWLIYRVSQSRDWFGPGRGDRAEQILRERYARGEIDRETYERMLDDLRVGRQS